MPAGVTKIFAPNLFADERLRVSANPPDLLCAKTKPSKLWGRIVVNFSSLVVCLLQPEKWSVL
jgi:hypothetical protein